MKKLAKVCIVAPCFNDWECIDFLYKEIKKTLDEEALDFEICIVNDHSSHQMPHNILDNKSNIHIINLTRNLGHQRAISIGICYALEHFEFDLCIVMDSDGEDKPSDITNLIKKYKSGNPQIIFAERRKRTESTLFRGLYFFYKIAFKSLTGYIIKFGNFVLIPREQLSSLVHISEIWNHFPGGIIRSKLAYDSVPIDRGIRYAGKSKMNFVSLVQHGISSITVNSDVVSVRLLIFSFVLLMSTILIFLTYLGSHYVFKFNLLNWYSYAFLGVLTIIVQSFFFSLLFAFMVLNTRNQNTFIPQNGFKSFIKKIVSSNLLQ